MVLLSNARAFNVDDQAMEQQLAFSDEQPQPGRLEYYSTHVPTDRLQKSEPTGPLRAIDNAQQRRPEQQAAFRRAATIEAVEKMRCYYLSSDLDANIRIIELNKLDITMKIVELVQDNKNGSRFHAPALRLLTKHPDEFISRLAYLHEVQTNPMSQRLSAETRDKQIARAEGLRAYGRVKAYLEQHGSDTTREIDVALRFYDELQMDEVRDYIRVEFGDDDMELIRFQHQNICPEALRWLYRERQWTRIIRRQQRLLKRTNDAVKRARTRERAARRTKVMRQGEAVVQ